MEEAVRKEIEKICNEELAKRTWGAKLSKANKGGMPRYLITDYRAFGLVTGIVRYYIRREDIHEKLFYRGQTEEWPLKPSLYRKIETHDKMDLADSWRKQTLEILNKEKFDYKGTPDEREALAQHYGLATSFIDIVDHFQTALWFACDGQKDNNSVGYVYVISVPEDEATIIDLRNKPSKWLRPHVQQGFCFKMNHITQCGRIPNDYHIMTLVVPRELLERWSNYDVIKHNYMYPPEEDDSSYGFWKRVEDHLKKDGLDTNPQKWIEERIKERNAEKGRVADVAE